MENEWTFLIRNLKPTTPYEVVMTKSIIVIPSEMTIIMMIMLICDYNHDQVKAIIIIIMISDSR